MNLRNYVSLLTAIVLLNFGISAAAQMRPECSADPTKPGACFFPLPEDSDAFTACEDGIIIWGPNTEPERAFGRLNPNGTLAVHLFDGTRGAGACRSSDFGSGICGTPAEPGIGVFFGDTSLQVNGFVMPDGSASCPFKLTSKGMLFRDIGNGLESAEIDAVLHFVKDKASETGCRIQQCRIFAPNGS
ncbi:MAG: hypothetical protein ACR2P1_27940 [Pseudomonadales bacterium]